MRGCVTFAACALYGCVLCVFGLQFLGGGDGVALPASIFASPLSAFGATGILYGAPLVWSVFGLLLSLSRRRDLPAVFLGVHLGVALVFMLVGTPLGMDAAAEWRRWSRPGADVGGAALVFGFYVTGQVAFWILALRRSQGSRRAEA
jgi:hypothetical protein